MGEAQGAARTGGIVGLVNGSGNEISNCFNVRWNSRGNL